MLFWLVPLIFISLSFSTIVFLGVKYMGKVAAIDISSDPERAKNERKRSMYMRRIERIGEEKTKTVKHSSNKLWMTIKSSIKAIYRKAQAMERHYKRLQKESKDGVAGTHEVRNNLREEAAAMIEREAYTGAEQRLIELLSLDPKNSEVYEMLGGVYIKMRKWNEAKETLQYANTVNPEDASVLTSLGELAMRDADIQKAVEYFNKAVDLKPTNPKYIDFLIESSILDSNKDKALKGIKLMKEVNPENKKIKEFEERTTQIKKQ